jgi:hypothetical protein
MTLFDQEAIEAAAKAMKSVMCKQLDGIPLLGDTKSDDWTATGGSIDFTELFEIGLTAAEASLRARGMVTEGKHTSFGEGGAGSTMVGSCEFWRGDFKFAIIRIAREDAA